ncbi:MAG: hypothetical protein M1838_002368 [Thelocarpon superellum]|nr:MAG: hypothetical protein M1838_002368 [Thelocarpon superellum]
MAHKTPHIGQELLADAFNNEDASRIFLEKVKQKPLLLRPAETGEGPRSTPNAREARRQARASRQRARSAAQPRPKPLSAREKRELKIYEIPKEARKYAIYEPLHRLWVGYIQEMLGERCMPVTATAASKFCSADFHGAEIEVVRARCVGRVGLRGIVLKDTKFTFEIITRRDEMKILPKEHSIFRFEVPPPSSTSSGDAAPGAVRNLVFELHGSQFESRATDRANKKFKQRNLPEL